MKKINFDINKFNLIPNTIGVFFIILEDKKTIYPKIYRVYETDLVDCFMRKNKNLYTALKQMFIRKKYKNIDKAAKIFKKKNDDIYELTAYSTIEECRRYILLDIWNKVDIEYRDIIDLFNDVERLHNLV